MTAADINLMFTAIAFRNLNQITIKKSLGVGRNTLHREVSLRQLRLLFFLVALVICDYMNIVMLTTMDFNRTSVHR